MDNRIKTGTIRTVSYVDVTVQKTEKTEIAARAYRFPDGYIHVSYMKREYEINNNIKAAAKKAVILLECMK